MKSFWYKAFSVAALVALLFSAFPARVGTVQAASPDIVISQVYGGGGNTSAPYTNDFVEIFNRGAESVSLSGLSIQYASATGTGNFSSNGIVLLSGTLNPGQYYLVQQASGGTNGGALPAPDATGAVNMSGTGGKVALVASTSGLACNGNSTPCSAAQLALIKDLIGWGSANFYETAAAPATTNATAAIRKASGCTETDNNSADFEAAAPTPRNTASAVNVCPVALPNIFINDVSANEGNSGTTTFSFTVSLSAPAGAGGVTFDIATADGTATTADNDYASNSLTSQTIPAGSSSYTFDVAVNGDTGVETDETFFVNVTNVTGATVVDGQGQGTIKNDDATLPNLTINDVSLSEGNSGTTTFKFTVSLSEPAGADGVTFDIATADNTATSPSDYTANALTSQTISSGSSSYTFDVLVNGDTAFEQAETFFVNVSNLSGAVIADGQGLGTIQNDDVSSGGNVVISQVYGGGGNSGATYKNDFIELYNRSSSPVDLNGWSVQYGSATGTTNWTNKTDLTGVILPGKYYLIQEAAGAGGTVDLPTPNAVGNIAMNGTAGKVALVNNKNLITGSGCPFSASVVDFVGYGTTANCSETTPTGNLSNTTAALRKSDGAQDTDNNTADFTIGAPNPRNTPPPVNLTISDVSLSEGNSGTTTFTFTVNLSAPAETGGVTFDIATADGTAVAPGDYTAKSLIGQTIPEGSSSYTFDVLVNGDMAVEDDETFLVNVTNMAGGDSLVDGQGLGTILNDDNVCTQPYTPIYTIQGSGASAAITGLVTTMGVVVGDFEGTAADSGFFMQDMTGDGDPATSDGIFVYTGSNNLVSEGQVVRVNGYARERFNQTTINGSNNNTADVTAANIFQCGTGSVPYTDVTMPFASANFLERYEGMLVRLPQSLVISEYFNYDQYGEIVLALPLDGETRPFTGTAVDLPGDAANARTLANSLRRITLDDNQSAQNPPVLRHPNGQPFSLSNFFRGGDLVKNTVGILGYDFSLYRIYPTGPAEYTATNPRPTAPEPLGGSVHVAAMNTLNFFVTADYPTGNPGDNKCGPLQTLECRGWDYDQPTEFTRQRDKLLTALTGLNADVIGLNELENTPGVEPLASIVAGLPGYDYINTGVIGTDAIKVGMIYRPAVVTPVGDFKLLTTAVDSRFLDTKNRPSLAQTFEVNATGARFTVVINHFKSKGSDCNDVGDTDLLDGQGNCSQTRRAAAQALVDWLATDPTGSGDPDFLILGDLNSYAMEDTITAIKAGPDDTAGTADDYTNLISKYQGPYAYSYTFDGQAGYLDQALASSSMASQVAGAEDWHINSDESDVWDYDTTYKPLAQEALYEVNPNRTSDHDPVIVGLTPNAAPVAANDSYTTDEDTPLTVAAPGVLVNDTDGNGDPLTAVLVSGPTKGTLVLNSDGSFTYTPNANYNGSDSFTYTAHDGSADSNEATVSITVNAVNDAPVAVDDSYSMNEDTALTVAAPGVLANDTDVDSASLTAVLVAGPSHGTLTLNADGSFGYTPSANYNGSDSFTYKANDGKAASNMAIVSITVNVVNDAPVAANDSYSTNEDTTLNVAAPGVLSNDSDVDFDSLTAVLVSGASHGTLTLNANGSFSYTPALNYNGPDSFTYKVSDGLANSNTATVSITVNAVNDAPDAVNDTAKVKKNASVDIRILANDTDIEGDTLTVVSFTRPAHGKVEYSTKNKNFEYTPTKGFSGTDTFTYTISDGHGGTDTATVTITVK
jgi:uncharacterized protein